MAGAYSPLASVWMALMMLVDVSWTAFGVSSMPDYCISRLRHPSETKPCHCRTDLVLGLHYMCCSLVHASCCGRTAVRRR